MEDYTKKADDFLQAHGITFSAQLIGSDCPMFCEDAEKGREMAKVDTYPRRTHVHGKHYRCTFTRTALTEPKTATAALVIDFWNSYADEEYNALGTDAHRHGETPFKYGLVVKGRKTSGGKRTPTAYDVLSCIQKYEIGSFEDFCGEFGYDTDSRKAETIYRAVVSEYKRAKAFFTQAELTEAQEIN